jgi:hypothetical protein
MKDALGHGSNSRGGPAKPIPGHPYHQKSDAELRYIVKDAGAARDAMRGVSEQAENKYADQMNDASTVPGYRDRGGKQDTPPGAHSQGITEHVGTAYYARVSAKNGNKLAEYGPHVDRESAAREAFANHPRQKSVSTSRGLGMDIRWHNRGDV